MRSRLPPLRMVHTTAFRWTVGSAGIVGVTIALMGAFFYWQTVVYFTYRLDAGLLLEERSLLNENRRVLVLRLEKSLAVDPRRNKAYALFGPAGERLAGNVASLPESVPPSDAPVDTLVSRMRAGAADPVGVRAVAARLPDGSVLFLGRVASDLAEIDEMVTRAMALAVIPGVILALAGGAAVSLGTLRRVEEARRVCSLIMAGQFDRRLPVGRRRDEFDRLSDLVNRMLDDVERLIDEVRGAGDAIAHDLRTPLTRLRARLDRALDPDTRHAPLAEVLQKSVADVDQLLSTVTAILRIAEVEQGRRQSGFGAVDLEDVVDAVSEVYAPIAEDKDIAFEAVREPTGPLRGDRDLVFEAVANLVDNAVKFTPPGGRVGIALSREPGRDGGEDGPVIRVWDTGPGIPPRESEAVTRRFYRVDRSRKEPGTGLGLSLVAAIARLHGFALAIGEREGGGCIVMLDCRGGQERDGAARVRAA